MPEQEGVGVTDSVSTDTSQETAQTPVAEEVKTVDAGAESQEAIQAEPAEQEDVEQVLADTEADDGTPLIKRLRQTIKSLQGNRQAVPELSETDREAVELYQGLTSFDNENNRPSAKPFAEKLFQKNPDLAYQAAVDILGQKTEDGWTLGHHFLKANGIDPTRLDDVKSFLNGEVKGNYQEIPEYVPNEYHEAFKNLSQLVRENLEYQLASDNPDEKQAAMEVLQDRQWRLDQRKKQEETEQNAKVQFTKDVEVAVEADTIETFTKFIQDFKTSPTYTSVQVSSNPAVDQAVKGSVNQMMLNLAEPNSVAGQQALAYFKDLGVTVNLPEVEQCLNVINGSTETSIRAAKTGYQQNKALADAAKMAAIQRLSGIRNAIFSQTIKKLAGEQQSSQQTVQNAGLPNFGGSTPESQGQKTDTLAWIKARVGK